MEDSNSTFNVGMNQDDIRIVIPDDNDEKSKIINYIQTKEPKFFKAIQYSGMEIDYIVKELLKIDCEITIFLYDPRVVGKEKKQHRRMLAAHTEYKRLEREFNKKISRYYYYTPPSIRGMNFDDDFFSVGWYVQFPNDERDTGVEIYGHNQPHINGYSSTPEGEMMSKFFTKQYERLDAKRISAEEIEKYWRACGEIK